MSVKRIYKLTVAGIFVLTWAACGACGGEPAPKVDAAGSDATVTDAAAQDAGLGDGATLDSAAQDVARSEAGADGGASDAADATVLIFDASGQADAQLDDAAARGDASVPDAAGPDVADAAGPPAPADPSQVAPAVDPGLAQTFADLNDFLFAGAEPVQFDADAAQMDGERLSVVRGRVLGDDGAPLAGVSISVAHHPEFGWTLSRDDGRFDLAVNGGGRLLVDYGRQDLLPLQRAIETEWNRYYQLDDVVMIAPDALVTPVDFGVAAPQIVRGSAVSDDDGPRQPTLLIPGNVLAFRVAADGSSQPLGHLSLRATEYTVGPFGPARMPAPLPPQSAYTHAVELSADEISPGDGESVVFSRPLAYYLENFLGFAVGEIVPAGFYDRGCGCWRPSANGRVVEILDIVDGRAQLDLDGDAVANSGASLSELGIDDDELAQLASLYAVGQSLWRTPIPHLTPWDCNWPEGPPQGAEPPDSRGPRRDRDDDPCARSGSIIGCQSQSLGEVIDIAGSPYDLRYSSQRQPGFRGGLDLRVTLTGTSLPATPPKSVELRVEIAGRTLSWVFAASPGMEHLFRWDGHDLYGRRVSGEQHGTVTISYRYDSQYYGASAAFAQAFAQLGSAVALPIPARSEVLLQRSFGFKLGQKRADPRQQVGGWSFDQHHVYDPLNGTLYLGSGERRSYSMSVIDTVLEPGRVFGLVVAADGALYFSTEFNIFKLDVDGAVTTVAGSGQEGSSGNGGPALLADMRPAALAFGPEGDLYFVDSYRPGSIRRVDTDGIVHAVAGAPGFSVSGDGSPAIDASVWGLAGIAVGADGAVYLAEQLDHSIRKISASGIIETIAGGNGRGYTGDGGPARDARLSYPSRLAIGPDGALYFTDQRQKAVRKIDAAGQISTVAGDGIAGFEVFGVTATATHISATHLAVGADGSLYISGNGLSSQNGVRQWHDLIRRLRPDGIIELFAGNTSTSGFGGDGGPAVGSELSTPSSIAVGPDGALYIADYGNNRVRRVSAGLSAQLSGYLVPSGDGAGVYEFDANGRHLATRDALTGRVLHSFSYDAQGALVGLTDRYGRSTVVERDASGVATAIVSPTGQRTDLAVDGAGYLASVTQPGGESLSLTYDGGGLLTSIADYLGSSASFAYDTDGRLVSDTQRGGGVIALDRGLSEAGFEVQVTDAEGAVTRYQNQSLDDGGLRKLKTSPAGAVTEAVLAADQSLRVRYPDGMQAVFTRRADPRWGVLAMQPAQIITTTPAGLEQIVTISREAALSDAADPMSLVSQQLVLDINGSVFTRRYDALSRMYTNSSAAGWSEERHYDSEGRLVQIAADGMDSLDLAYDNDGRLMTAQVGDLLMRRSYDAQGRLVELGNALDESVSYSYDADGRLSALSLPTGQDVGLSFDANGNLVQLDLPSGASYGFDYDANGRRSALTFPGGSQLRFDRRLDGRVSSWQLPSGRVVDRYFDAAGRFAGHSDAEASLDVTYLDSGMRPAHVDWTASATGTTQRLSFAYDGALRVEQRWSGAAAATYTYRHDDAFEVVGVSLNGGPERARVLDADGRVVGDGDFGFTRAGPMGRVTAISDSVMHLSQTYDTLGRLLSRSLRVAGQAVYDLSLSYDAAGRRLGDDERVLAGPSVTRAYTYDLMDQLLQVKQDAVVTESYAYDANGNRVSSDLGGGAMSSLYDVQDRITQHGGTAYQVDADGMLAQAGADTFVYSARGELMEASVGASTVTYVYDGLGRRVQRSVGAQSWSYFYGDPDKDLRPSASRAADGSWTEYYYDDMSRLYALRRAGQWYYVGSDALGSPRVVVDALGQRVKEITYSAFGERLADSDPAFELDIGFAGGLRDPLTGLVHFWRRDYDPVTARFTARDPIDFSSGQLNLYAYAGNNPLGRRDLTGLASFGISAYSGIGGGLEVHLTRDGWALCADAGLGGGIGVSFNPFSDELPDDSTLDISLSGGGSFFGTGVNLSDGWGLVFCPDGRSIWVRKSEIVVRTALSEYSSDSLDAPAEWQGYNPSIDSGFGASLTASNCRSYNY